MESPAIVSSCLGAHQQSFMRGVWMKSGGFAWLAAYGACGSQVAFLDQLRLRKSCERGWRSKLL